MPQNDNLEQAYAAGQALAELGKVLPDIQVEAGLPASAFPPSYDFEGWAGVPVDPWDLIRKLPLTKEEHKQTIALLENTQAFASSLYQTSPQQIIHRDYDQSNILTEGNSITAVWILSSLGRTCESLIWLMHYRNGLPVFGTLAKNGLSAMHLAKDIWNVKDSPWLNWRCCLMSFGCVLRQVYTFGSDVIDKILKP